MKIVVFGLVVSSSWGNGHATLWRSLARGLSQMGHTLTFFERDVPYYASHRDSTELAGGRLVLYRQWEEIESERVPAELAEADAALVTSYCQDASAASMALLESKVPVRGFYDLDTPVTLARLEAGEPVGYIPSCGLAAFDVVLSFTGGASLRALEARLGARRALPLYGSVDPAAHHPVEPDSRFRADLSYLGTYSADRQRTLADLLIEPAQRMPKQRFLLGGSLYPEGFPWTENLHYLPHVAPPDHPAFYCSSPLTLNITRAAMATSGWCPSGRLFEAAACGTPVLSDVWPGVEDFFEPGKEILLAHSADEVIELMRRPRKELDEVGAAARKRAVAEHTGLVRARQLVEYLTGSRQDKARTSASYPAVAPTRSREVAGCGE